MKTTFPELVKNESFLAKQKDAGPSVKMNRAGQKQGRELSETLFTTMPEAERRREHPQNVSNEKFSVLFEGGYVLCKPVISLPKETTEHIKQYPGIFHSKKYHSWCGKAI